MAFSVFWFCLVCQMILDSIPDVVQVTLARLWILLYPLCWATSPSFNSPLCSSLLLFNFKSPQFLFIFFQSFWYNQWERKAVVGLLHLSCKSGFICYFLENKQKCLLSKSLKKWSAYLPKSFWIYAWVFLFFNLFWQFIQWPPITYSPKMSVLQMPPWPGRYTP